MLSEAEIVFETSEDQRQDAVLEDLNFRYVENNQSSEENHMEAILKDLKARTLFDDKADQQDLAIANFTKKVCNS